jgi:mannitol/fructose-specific phosphotransferase system IIA component (Ntr-type)
VNPTSRKQIGQILCENGYLKQSQLKQLLAEQKKGKHRQLGQLLLERGYITTEQLDEAIALQEERPHVKREAKYKRPDGER